MDWISKFTLVSRVSTVRWNRSTGGAAFICSKLDFILGSSIWLSPVGTGRSKSCQEGPAEPALRPLLVWEIDLTQAVGPIFIGDDPDPEVHTGLQSELRD